MKPRERMISSLNFIEPDDMVPSWEIEFHLFRQLLGEMPVIGCSFDSLTRSEKVKATWKNAELFIKMAEKLDQSAITVPTVYWEASPGIPALLWIREPEWRTAMIKALKSISDDEFFIIVYADSTIGIPTGKNLDGLITMIYEEPEELTKLAEKRLRDGLEEGLRAAEAGADAVTNASDIAFNTGCFFTPDQFDSFIGPYMERWASRFKKEGIYTIYHTDGDISKNMDKLIATGMSAIQCIDPIAGLDIVKMKEIYRGQITLIGNVDTRTLELGTDDEIEAECRYILEGCKKGGGFVFGACNAVYEGIPIENYMVMVEAKKKYGALPGS